MHDDDIDLGALARLSPHQPRLWFHRYQHFYLWALYAFLAIKWQLFDDFRDMARAQIGSFKFTRPRGWELAGFIAGKVAFATFAFVIPILSRIAASSASSQMPISTPFFTCNCWSA